MKHGPTPFEFATEQGGSLGPSGTLAKVVTRDLGELRKLQVQRPPIGWRVANFFRSHLRSAPALITYRILGRIFSLVYVETALYLKVLKADGTVIDYGCVGRRVVTDVGVGFIVDAFQNLVELENMKFHGFGTGTNAEAAGDTSLQTELTTEYATDNVRPTGTTTEGATANIYRTVATFTPNAGGTIANTEHGLFSQAATGGGVLFDRTKYAAVNVTANQDSIQATYEATFASGS